MVDRDRDPDAAGSRHELGGLLDRLRAVVLRTSLPGAAARAVHGRARLSERHSSTASGAAGRAGDQRDLAIERSGHHRELNAGGGGGERGGGRGREGGRGPEGKILGEFRGRGDEEGKRLGRGRGGEGERERREGGGSENVGVGGRGEGGGEGVGGENREETGGGERGWREACALSVEEARGRKPGRGPRKAARRPSGSSRGGIHEGGRRARPEEPQDRWSADQAPPDSTRAADAPQIHHRYIFPLDAWGTGKGREKGGASQDSEERRQGKPRPHPPAKVDRTPPSPADPAEAPDNRLRWLGSRPGAKKRFSNDSAAAITNALARQGKGVACRHALRVAPALPYEAWSATCDTLHAHTQVLGKLAVALAPPEPQLQHAALRLTARGWETLAAAGARRLRRARRRARPAHARGASPSTATGACARVALTPDRPVGEVTRELLAAVARPRRRRRDRPDAAGGAVDGAARRGRRARHLRPRSGRALLRGRDARRARAGGLPRAVPRALDAGQRVVGLVRPRREPVLRPAGRSAVGRLHHAQLDGLAGGRRRLVARRRALRQGRLLRLRAPGAGGVRGRDALARRPRAGTRRSASTSSTGTTSAPSADPHAAALEFARSAFRHACAVCDWDPALPASADGTPPPVR